MRTTLNLKPAAVLMVKSLARHQKISEGEAASALILNGGAGHQPGKFRNGIELVENDGVPITSEEVRAFLYDA